MAQKDIVLVLPRRACSFFSFLLFENWRVCNLKLFPKYHEKIVFGFSTRKKSSNIHASISNFKSRDSGKFSCVLM